MRETQLWPGWETVRVIGSGGFGKVYEIRKAEDSETGDYRSALKVITIPQSPEDYRAYEDDGYDEKSIHAIFREQVDDIVSEFQMMSQFRGTSNIVSYEDHRIVPHEDGRGWDILIRMELLTTLPEYFNQHGMSEADTVKLGRDICRALELCGQKDIIHRDIKPQNIFVNEFGDFKLGDFGIAKSMDHTTKATKIGTYSYMAPEVYRNMPYNASVDTYSLGLVMYWLLNERRLPFLPLPPAVPTAAQNNEAQMKRLGGEAVPASKNGSPALKAVVLKALSPDPAGRFSSPEAFAGALQSCAGATEETYADEETSWGEETAAQDTWARISYPGRRTAAPAENPPAGEPTQGTWDNTAASTALQWTQRDPWEKQEAAQEAKKAGGVGDRPYARGRSYEGDRYNSDALEEEQELLTAEEEDDSCCPWCKGSGREMRVLEGAGYQAYLQSCEVCDSLSELKDKKGRKELRNQIDKLQQTPEAKNAKPDCHCCGGRGWVHMCERSGIVTELQPCPACQGKKVDILKPVRRRKSTALLLFITIGWCTGAHCFYEKRFFNGLTLLGMFILAVLSSRPGMFYDSERQFFGAWCFYAVIEAIFILSRPKGSYLMVEGWSALPDPGPKRVK